MNQKDANWYMGLALEEAEKAFRLGEVPVGACIVDPAGKLVLKTHNLKEKIFDPTGHAEVIAIREASVEKKTWRLTGHSLYVTLEPCCMCMGAISQARIANVIFGAYDPKGGAISLGYNIHKNEKLNHQFNVVGGAKHYECSKIISDFFRLKRRQYKQEP